MAANVFWKKEVAAVIIGFCPEAPVAESRDIS